MLSHITGEHETMVQRIMEIGKERPEVYDVTNPYDLLKFGFKCDDIKPSLGTVCSAFKDARSRAKGGQHD